MYLLVVVRKMKQTNTINPSKQYLRNSNFSYFIQTDNVERCWHIASLQLITNRDFLSNSSP